MEAFKVGVTLQLHDLLGARLAALWDDFDKLEKKTVQVRRRLRDLGVETAGLREAGGAVRAMQRDMLLAEKNIGRMSGAFKNFNGGNASGGIRSMHGEFQRVQASASALEGGFHRAQSAATALTTEIGGIGVQVPELRAAATAIGRMATNLATAGVNARALGAHLYGVASAAARIPAMPNIPNIPRGGFGGGGGGGGGRGGHGGGGGGGIHGGNVHVGSHGVGVGAMGVGMDAAGGAALIGGYVAYQGVKSFAHEAGEYQREQALFRMFGMSEAQNKEAFRYAGNMNVPGASRIDSLRYVTEAQGVFRESGMKGSEALEGAKLVAPILAKLHYASSLSGHTMDEAGEKSMLRFVEQRGGLKSPEELLRIADLGFKVSMTSGGNVDWEQLRQMMRTGSVAAKGLSDEALFAWGEPLIGELKGGGFGTGLRTAFNRMNGIVKVPNQAYHEMERLGIWDKSKIVENANGGIKSFKSNPLIHAEEYAANPFKYYADYILPKYDKLKLSPAERNRENSMIFGGTGSMLFSTLEQQLSTILKSLPALNAAKGVEAGVKERGKTLGGKEDEFGAAWSDFKSVFGDSVLPGVIEVLKTGTTMMQGFIRIGQADGVIGKLQAAWKEWNTGAFAPGYVTHPQALPGAARPDPVAKPSTAAVQVNSAVHIDGIKVANAVTKHQVKGLSGNLGSGFYDLGVGMPSVGMK